MRQGLRSRGDFVQCTPFGLPCSQDCHSQYTTFLNNNSDLERDLNLFGRAVSLITVLPLRAASSPLLSAANHHDNSTTEMPTETSASNTRWTGHMHTHGGRATCLHKVDGPCPSHRGRTTHLHIGRATHGGRARRLHKVDGPHAYTRWTGHALHTQDGPHTEEGPDAYKVDWATCIHTDGPHTNKQRTGHMLTQGGQATLLRTDDGPHAYTCWTSHTRRTGHAPTQGRTGHTRTQGGLGHTPSHGGGVMPSKQRKSRMPPHGRRATHGRWATCPHMVDGPLFHIEDGPRLHREDGSHGYTCVDT